MLLLSTAIKIFGPGVNQGWEPIDKGWKFKQDDGTYLTMPGDRTATANGYYLNERLDVKDANTPDSLSCAGADGV